MLAGLSDATRVSVSSPVKTPFLQSRVLYFRATAGSGVSSVSKQHGPHKQVLPNTLLTYLILELWAFSSINLQRGYTLSLSQTSFAFCLYCVPIQHSSSGKPQLIFPEQLWSSKEFFVSPAHPEPGAMCTMMLTT